MPCGARAADRPQGQSDRLRASPFDATLVRYPKGRYSAKWSGNMTYRKPNLAEHFPNEEQPRQPPRPDEGPRHPDPPPDEHQPQQPPRPEDEPNKKRPHDEPPFPKPPLPPG